MTLPHRISAEQSVKLKLCGSVPSKKNTWARARNGGMYLPKEVRAQIDALQLQAQAQWGGRNSVSDAHVKARFFVKDRRSDLDNKFVCLMDVLVKAGVLVNDSIAHVRSFEASAVVTSLDERVEIEVS